MEDSTVKKPSSTRPWASLVRHEDWLAVWTAAIFILLVLAGFRITLPIFWWNVPSDLRSIFIADNFIAILFSGFTVAIFTSLAARLMGSSVVRFFVGFPVLYILACVALLLAGNATVSNWGFEYVIFAFLVGLIISNCVGVPDWLMEVVRTEFYIKVGLVILGTNILFGNIMQGGFLGLIQALLVVTVVWSLCFRLAKRLNVDDEFAAILASAVSICGVSAAIAACGAIQGDRKKLSYVTSLVLIVAAPMMVVMPHLVSVFSIPDVVGGAWLGGTLDTSASVVASGEMISEVARDAAVVVKLSQNVLIGVAAFMLTIWWTVKDKGAGHPRPSAKVIWERFPKFVLGFIVASFVFSFVVSEVQIAETKALLTNFRTIWFTLAFVSIGLETRFTDLLTVQGGRPALAFLGGQIFNIFWTLLLAYLIFGGVFFQQPAFG